ncbi:uncharacterized protein LOC127545803 isoform X11 [Antechinus flavipes]|uniref:uncharacterized protein LOC127545803 isoform X11 n=1 Tax=Antechinus flavipes TaxID=38775 RepID=UPI0022357B0D|nr:uncharacterized protein LOC127545803 isoform X11 [Antechinus flavipes]
MLHRVRGMLQGVRGMLQGMLQVVRGMLQGMLQVVRGMLQGMLQVVQGRLVGRPQIQIQPTRGVALGKSLPLLPQFPHLSGELKRKRANPLLPLPSKPPTRSQRSLPSGPACAGGDVAGATASTREGAHRTRSSRAFAFLQARGRARADDGGAQGPGGRGAERRGPSRAEATEWTGGQPDSAFCARVGDSEWERRPVCQVVPGKG